MKTIDLDRIRCEKKLSLKEFAVSYNEGLPEGYPQVTPALLKIFTASNKQLFKEKDEWSLDIHRKKVMDWLPSYLRNTEREA